MRILVCGDRHWTDRGVIERTLSALHFQSHVTEVIVGECYGVDTIARGVAFELGLTVRQFVADWSRWGRAAGPRRNRAMLEAQPDLIVAFHDNLEASKGTRNMVAQARHEGVPVILVDRWENRMELLPRR